MTEQIDARTTKAADKQKEAIKFFKEYPIEFLEFATQNFQEKIDELLEAFRLDTLRIYEETGFVEDERNDE